MTTKLDPNLHPVRPDLAASRYRGVVAAKRFADPVTYKVTAGVCPVRKEPAGDGEQLSQALHGDYVDILEERDGFGWGQMLSDGYVGWFDMDALSAPVQSPTHRVIALRTYGYSGPSVKSAPHFLLSLNATVTVTDQTEGNLVFCGRSGWIAASHLAPIGTGFASDPVSVAEQFLHAPYQWGGRESLGLDCSGLVQIAHLARGIALPRDSYMQREVGEAVEIGADLSGLKRGDLVCWRGHVGLMVDGAHMIHANGYHAATVIEPLAEAVARIDAQYGPILTVRRLG
jgi:cell wall-associated NlpC family hydrolase